jgi:hypothetical protein
MWARGLVNGLTVEASSGVSVVEPLTATAEVTTTGGKQLLTVALSPVRTRLLASASCRLFNIGYQYFATGSSKLLCLRVYSYCGPTCPEWQPVVTFVQLSGTLKNRLHESSVDWRGQGF